MRESLANRIKIVLIISMVVFDAVSLPQFNPHAFDLPSFSRMAHPDLGPQERPSRKTRSAPKRKKARLIRGSKAKMERLKRKLDETEIVEKKKPTGGSPVKKKKCSKVFGSYCKEKTNNGNNPNGKKRKISKKRNYKAHWDSSIYGTHEYYKKKKPVWDENDRNKGKGKRGKKGKGKKGAKGGKGAKASNKGKGVEYDTTKRIKNYDEQIKENERKKRLAELARLKSLESGAKGKSGLSDKAKLGMGAAALGAGALAAGAAGAALASKSKSKSKSKSTDGKKGAEEEKEKEKEFLPGDPWELNYDPKKMLKDNCFGFELSEKQFKNILSQETYANSTSTMIDIDPMEPYVTSLFPNEAPGLIFFPIKGSLFDTRTTPESEIKHYNFMVKTATKELYDKKNQQDVDAVAEWDEWYMYKNRLYAAIMEVRNLRLLNYERTCEEEDPFEPRPEPEEVECDDPEKSKSKKSKAAAAAAAGLGAGAAGLGLASLMAKSDKTKLEKRVGDEVIKKEFGNDKNLKKNYEMSLEERRKKMDSYDKDIAKIRKKHKKQFKKETKKRDQRKRRRRQRRRRYRRGRGRRRRRRRQSRRERRKGKGSKAKRRGKAKGSSAKGANGSTGGNGSGVPKGSKAAAVTTANDTQSSQKKSQKHKGKVKSKFSPKRLNKKNQQTKEIKDADDVPAMPWGKRKGRNRAHKWLYRFGHIKPHKKKKERILESNSDHPVSDEELENAIYEELYHEFKPTDESNAPPKIQNTEISKEDIRRSLVVDILSESIKPLMKGNNFEDLHKMVKKILEKGQKANTSKPAIKERKLSALSTLFGYFHGGFETQKERKLTKTAKKSPPGCKSYTEEEKKAKEEEKKKKEEAEKKRKEACEPKATFVSFYKKASEELKAKLDIDELGIDSLPESTHIKSSKYIPKFYGCAYYYEGESNIHLFYWRKGMRRIDQEKYFTADKQTKFERLKSLIKNVEFLNEYGYVVSDMRSDQLGYPDETSDDLMLIELPSLIRNNTDTEKIKTLTKQSAPELLQGANRGTPYLYLEKDEKKYYDISADLFSLAHIMHQTIFGFQIYTGTLDPYLSGRDFSETAHSTFMKTQIEFESMHYMDLDDAEKAQVAADPDSLKTLAEEKDRMVEYKIFSMEKKMFDYDPKKRPKLDEVADEVEEAEEMSALRGEKPLQGSEFKMLGLIEMIKAIAESIVSMISAMGIDVMAFLIGGFLFEFLTAILAVLGTSKGSKQKAKDNKETADGPVDSKPKSRMLADLKHNKPLRYQLERLANIAFSFNGTEKNLLQLLRTSSDLKMAGVADVYLKYKKKAKRINLRLKKTKLKSMNEKSSLRQRQNKIMLDTKKKSPKKTSESKETKLDKLEEEMKEKYAFDKNNVGVNRKSLKRLKKERMKKKDTSDKIMEQMKEFYHYNDKHVGVNRQSIRRKYREYKRTHSLKRTKLDFNIGKYLKNSENEDHRKLVIDSEPKLTVEQEKKQFYEKMTGTSDGMGLLRKEIKNNAEAGRAERTKRKAQKDAIGEMIKEKYKFNKKNVGIKKAQNKEREKGQKEMSKLSNDLRKKYSFDPRKIGVNHKHSKKRNVNSNEQLMQELKKKYGFNDKKVGLERKNRTKKMKKNDSNELDQELMRKYRFNPKNIGKKRKIMNLQREQQLEMELKNNMEQKFKYSEKNVGIKKKTSGPDQNELEIESEMKKKWDFDPNRIEKHQNKIKNKKEQKSSVDKKWGEYLSKIQINPEHIGIKRDREKEQEIRRAEEEKKVKDSMMSKWKFDDSKVGEKKSQNVTGNRQKNKKELEHNFEKMYSFDQKKINRDLNKKVKTKKRSNLKDFQKLLKQKYFGKKNIWKAHSKRKEPSHLKKIQKDEIEEKMKASFAFDSKNVMKREKRRSKGHKSKHETTSSDLMDDFRKKYSFDPKNVNKRRSEKVKVRAKPRKLDVEQEKMSFMNQFEHFDQKKVDRQQARISSTKLRTPEKPKQKKSIEEQKKEFLSSLPSFGFKV